MSREDLLARLQNLYAQMDALTAQLTPEEQRELVAMFQAEAQAEDPNHVPGPTSMASLTDSIATARKSALEVASQLPESDLREFVEALEANLQHLQA